LIDLGKIAERAPGQILVAVSEFMVKAPNLLARLLCHRTANVRISQPQDGFDGTATEGTIWND
jgi:hypothetical protein